MQSSHVVPVDNYEVGYVQTGYESVIAHRVSDNFAVTAPNNGKVVDVDEKTGVFIVQYDPTVITTSGDLKVPYTTSILASHMKSGALITIVIGASELVDYPLGKVFSLSAEYNGIVTSTEEDLDINSVDAKLLKTRPDLIAKIKDHRETALVVVSLKITGKTVPGEKIAYRYGERFTPVSGSYLKQQLDLNVTQGESVKRGDVLAYNKGFFSEIPGTKQVNWKLGVMSTVALMEKAETLEDGSIISASLGERLTMSPAHIRTITLTNDTSVRQIVSLGDHVETTDPICTFIEGDLDALVNSANEDTLAFITSIEKKAPRAHYHGRVAQIDMYYSCPYEKLNPTLQSISRSIEKRHKAISLSMRGTTKEGSYQYNPQVPIGMKYHGVEFQENTVVIEFTISESIVCGVGDKCVIGAANKTVVSSVMEEPYYTQSGIPIDAMYGCASAAARIVNSIYVMGIGNRVIHEIQDQAVADYFK